MSSQIKSKDLSKKVCTNCKQESSKVKKCHLDKSHIICDDCTSTKTNEVTICVICDECECCDETIYQAEMVKCDACGSSVHDECFTLCASDCGTGYCKNCEDNKLKECYECESQYCEDCYKVCTHCNKLICNSCKSKHSFN